MPYKDPEVGRARAKARYVANRTKILARQEVERRANGVPTREETNQAKRRPKPDRTEYLREYIKTPTGRAKHVANSAARRARRLSQFVEHVDLAVVWARDRGICHICSQPADPADWHLEHKVPLSRGGEHSYENTAVSHPSCNKSKGAKLPSPRIQGLI